MSDSLPGMRPPTPLLDSLALPQALNTLSLEALAQLADEVRAFLLYSVAQTGGHFSANLGVVELTVALHHLLNSPEDTLIWDVGHQAYAHKILTGRGDGMASLRQHEGLAPFPSRAESVHDAFGTGHSSTSISAALGIALGKRLQGQISHTVAVIGDGAMTAGMAFEALNHASHIGVPLLVILNDNAMSIGRNEGGLASYLARNFSGVSREDSDSEDISVPASIFTDMGFRYSGPVDGHQLPKLIQKLRKALSYDGPTLLHVRTQKGYGYAPALEDPIRYHALSKLPAQTAPPTPTQGERYQDVFGRWLCAVAAADTRLMGITPAMKEGSGMVDFAERFPERYVDVAIAEQHAVTLAAGLACSGQKPVLAIYSTFLQRAYDQLIHDVALQSLDVTFAIDRAGLVGEDGATHHGAFDLSVLSAIPNLIIACPSHELACEQLLYSAYRHSGPAAVRYPRGKGPGTPCRSEDQRWPIGRAEVVREGEQVCILNFGALLDTGRTVAESHDWGLVDMRWVKPLDEALLAQLAQRYSHFITLEDNVVRGGAGAAVLQWCQQQGLPLTVLTLGLPDRFIEHASRTEQLAACGLDEAGIEAQIALWLQKQPQ